MARVHAAPTMSSPLAARAFFSPAVDFLCLGGGSLIALPILGLLIPDSALPQVGVAVLILSVFINHPHFAHSYQIFYRSYDDVMHAPDGDRALRRRYLCAGFLLPLSLLCYFVLAVSWNAPAMLRFAANAMLFLGGWHYTKQGYGMLMVDAALKRSFFSERAKNLLTINAYACWALSWLLVNKVIAERNFLGLAYYTIDAPDVALVLAGIVAFITSSVCLGILVLHALKHGPTFPISGVAAYIASLYLWLFTRSEPELVALIPAFHSLQYLLVVWRRQMNVEAARLDASAATGIAPGGRPLRSTTFRLGLFVATGMLLGFGGFYAVPTLLDSIVAYNHGRFGAHLFLFMFWVFINIHHFFIDNAMWRKENPHTMKLLLANR
jgi:hypothetical protein